MKLDELSMALDVAITQLRQQGWKDPKLVVDHYWSIASDQRYQVYEEPREFTIGQLSEDLACVRENVADSSSITPMSLVWIGQLLIGAGDLMLRPT